MSKARENATQGGLVLLNSTSFTTASSIAFNNVFSSAYDNYRIMFVATDTSSSNSWTRMQLSVNGTASAGAYYGANTLFTGSTTYYNSIQNVSAGRVGLTHYGQPSTYNHIVEVSSPFRTVKTTVTSTGYWNNGSADGAHYGVFIHNVASSYDGFVILPDNGTVTGIIQVYGYKKA